MKTWIAVAALFSLALGCVGRIPLYSPRLPPTEDHRAATRNTACLNCHDLTQRQSHRAHDDCRDCHTLPQE